MWDHAEDVTDRVREGVIAYRVRDEVPAFKILFMRIYDACRESKGKLTYRDVRPHLRISS